MSNIAFTPRNAPQTQKLMPPRPLPSVLRTLCRLRLQFGVYFDGTNNNLDIDEATLSHSNVARLYRAALDQPLQGIHRIYVPGVGTSFPRIGEVTPHPAGSSQGVMGWERIRYAILRMVNDVSQKICGWEVVKENDLPEFVKSDNYYNYVKSILSLRIEQNRSACVEEIVLDVFGFSRGAAEARSFVNQLLTRFCVDGTFCGIPLRIRFMGLFDTVVSVGLADSVPAPVDGHQHWGDQPLLPIPPQVEQCVHLVAGHEGRNSFPVDLVLGKDGRYPSNCTEVVYPGMHSDVGGGYGPGDQGKAVRGQDQLLSQIALNDMYERAVKAGVIEMRTYLARSRRCSRSIRECVPRSVGRFRRRSGKRFLPHKETSE